MSWASKRKTLYVLVAVVFLVIVLGVPSFFAVYRAPTCSDGQQNQGELGIDCGGPCKNLCQEKALSPIILWQRVFKVTPGSYNAIAYIENPNVTAGASGVAYIFRLYDKNNVLISERTGQADLLPNKTFPIFESNVPAGQKIPTRVTFEFTKAPFWTTKDSLLPEIAVTGVVFSREDTTPHLEATIENRSVKNVANLPVVAIMYDTDGNAIAASRTVVDFLTKKSSLPLVFTWPEPFTKSISKKEITPILSQSNIQ